MLQLLVGLILLPSVSRLMVLLASFLRRLAFSLSLRWERSFADVIFWIHARLAFAILQATVLCMRGSRSRWHCLGLEDGASIDFT